MFNDAFNDLPFVHQINSMIGCDYAVWVTNFKFVTNELFDWKIMLGLSLHGVTFYSWDHTHAAKEIRFFAFWKRVYIELCQKVNFASNINQAS